MNSGITVRNLTPLESAIQQSCNKIIASLGRHCGQWYHCIIVHTGPSHPNPATGVSVVRWTQRWWKAGISNEDRRERHRQQNISSSVLTGAIDHRGWRTDVGCRRCSTAVGGARWWSSAVDFENQAHWKGLEHSDYRSRWVKNLALLFFQTDDGGRRRQWEHAFNCWYSSCVAAFLWCLLAVGHYWIG